MVSSVTASSSPLTEDAQIGAKMAFCDLCTRATSIAVNCVQAPSTVDRSQSILPLKLFFLIDFWILYYRVLTFYLFHIFQVFQFFNHKSRKNLSPIAKIHKPLCLDGEVDRICSSNSVPFIHSQCPSYERQKINVPYGNRFSLFC